MANTQTVVSVLRRQSPTTLQDTPLWRRARARSKPRHASSANKSSVKSPTTKSAPSTPNEGTRTSSSARQSGRHTAARGGKKHYNPTGPDYRPVGPEPMIIPAGKRDINTLWRRDLSPDSTPIASQSEEQQNHEPTTPSDSIDLLNEEQQPQDTLKPNSKQPQRKRRRGCRGGRRHNTPKVSPEEPAPMNVPASKRDINSPWRKDDSPVSTPITPPAEEQQPIKPDTTTRPGNLANQEEQTNALFTSSIVLATPEQQLETKPQGRRRRRRGWRRNRNPKSILAPGFTKVSYFSGPSWGRGPNPSTLPIPSFYNPRNKMNDPSQPPTKVLWFQEMMHNRLPEWMLTMIASMYIISELNEQVC